MGYPVAYHEAGSGQPMLMLHNGGCSHIIWKNQIEYFQQDYRVIAFDLLGFGDSGRPEFPFTLEVYVDMLASFIQQEKLEGPILFGNCIGGAISLQYALDNPHIPKALILTNICGGISMMKYFHPFMFPNSHATYPRWLYSSLFNVSAFNWVKKKVLHRLYGPKPNEESLVFQRLLEGLHHPKQPQSRLWLIEGLTTFSKFDHFQDDPSELPPLQVFWGKENKVLPLHRGELLMAKLQPQACHIYPEAGHLLMAEKAESFNQDVSHFLRQYAS